MVRVLPSMTSVANVRRTIIIIYPSCTYYFDLRRQDTYLNIRSALCTTTVVVLGHYVLFLLCIISKAKERNPSGVLRLYSHCYSTVFTAILQLGHHFFWIEEINGSKLSHISTCIPFCDEHVKEDPKYWIGVVVSVPECSRSWLAS
jgi:hypothetical protein